MAPWFGSSWQLGNTRDIRQSIFRKFLKSAKADLDIAIESVVKSDQPHQRFRYGTIYIDDIALVK